MTPSDAGRSDADDPSLRSPLSKRKRIIAERASSKLRETVLSEAILKAKEEAYGPGRDDVVMTEEEEEATEDEFDFLAGAMEEGDDDGDSDISDSDEEDEEMG